MIQWYPGHMAKAQKEMEEKLKLVDIVLELVDARIPISSFNPIIKEKLKDKPHIVLATKSNMADEHWNNLWQLEFAKNNDSILFIDSIKRQNLNKIIPLCKLALQEKIKKEKEKGMKERPIRAMVVGIPNVGKSTLINQLVGKKTAFVGDKPGVTKSQQWIKIHKDLDLLDTPGVLWPKFDEQKVAYHLALTGAIKDQIFHKDDVILYFISFMQEKYPGSLNQRYQIDEHLEKLEILHEIARAKNFYQKNEIDYERVFDLILNDFRSLKLGRITLDRFNNE